MSVVFVLSVQWPIGTNLTSTFKFILYHLSLQHEFENNTFAFTQISNILGKYNCTMTGSEKFGSIFG